MLMLRRGKATHAFSHGPMLVSNVMSQLVQLAILRIPNRIIWDHRAVRQSRRAGRAGKCVDTQRRR